MKRWHSTRERALMMRRWRQEIAVHEDDVHKLAPLPPEGNELCHCYRGMGFMRKRRPFGCGRARCGICHGEKLYAPKARATKVRDAIEFEGRACG